MNDRIRAYMRRSPLLVPLLLKAYRRVPGRNGIRVGKQNHLEVGSVFMKTTFISIEGIDNTVVIQNKSRLVACTIRVKGNHNSIVIGEGVSLDNVVLHIEDDHNRVIIGEHTTIEANTELAAIEGTAIEIGSDCMFSSNVRLATGDSHSVIDASGARVNPSKSIRIGNHVWIGARAALLKGVQVADNSIVGTGALVTHCSSEQNVVLAGNPASVVKHGVNWLRERV